MLPQKHLNVLQKIYNKLKETNINWVITGSTAFIIQGIPLVPSDIDIQTDIKKYKKYISFNDMQLPVLDLEYEYEAYMKMGRVEKAMLLKEWVCKIKKLEVKGRTRD
ncbi:MAG TPA: hypothetical protein GXX35_14235 [Thermoanaerobacterales bacterium]|nr:hypothetical protein [Thermoanaerobacterales bacterium]